MSLLDIVLVVIALGVAALTFTQSPFVTLADLFACYVAAVLAGLCYLPAASLPPFAILPANDRATLELGLFAALLVGGTLVLRGLARRLTGWIPNPGWLTGPLFPALSAGLSLLLALVVVLLAVLLVVAVAQMPSSAGLPTLARVQAAQSAVIPRLSLPLGAFLRAVNLWSGGNPPPVYRDLVYVLNPS